MNHIFALVDCNNFYASCERLFRPDLKTQPVIVLSNNDGCVVARSKEAKALGIKMGVPLFQIQQDVKRYGIQVFSSNYALYADLSSRVMRTLEALAPNVEIYSIDEAFLDVTGIEPAISLQAFGQQVRDTILHDVGLPVCVGFAPTKTLAKLANHGAKQYVATGGVVDLSSPERQKKLLALMPASEVWGVGRRLTAQLQALGIHTALDLANCAPSEIRKRFSVVLERTVRELNGECCIEMFDAPRTKQQIVCSRSFGSRVTDLREMRTAIGEYVARAAEKLRGEKQLARVVTVFIRTSPFTPNEPHYSNAATGRLPIPSCDTRDLMVLAHRLLDSIWREGYRYAKGGVMLNDFEAVAVGQADLFGNTNRQRCSDALMMVVDQVNQSGVGRLFFAGQGTHAPWRMNRNRLSPSYTTKWKELPTV